MTRQDNEQEKDLGASAPVRSTASSADAGTEPLPNRCEGRYPVGMKRDEPFEVTYRCALPHGHPGQCGAEISVVIDAGGAENHIGRNLSDSALLIGHGLLDWKQAALILGEQLAPCGPSGYYDFTPEQWLTWARSQVGSATQPLSEASASTGRSDSAKDNQHLFSDSRLLESQTIDQAKLGLKIQLKAELWSLAHNDYDPIAVEVVEDKLDALIAAVRRSGEPETRREEK